MPDPIEFNPVPPYAVPSCVPSVKAPETEAFPSTDNPVPVLIKPAAEIPEPAIIWPDKVEMPATEIPDPVLKPPVINAPPSTDRPVPELIRPDTDNPEPTLRLPLIPTPPITINAPVVVDPEPVVEPIVADPSKLILNLLVHLILTLALQIISHILNY